MAHNFMAQNFMARNFKARNSMTLNFIENVANTAGSQPRTMSNLNKPRIRYLILCMAKNNQLTKNEDFLSA